MSSKKRHASEGSLDDCQPKIRKTEDGQLLLNKSFTSSKYLENWSFQFSTQNQTNVGELESTRMETDVDMLASQVSELRLTRMHSSGRGADRGRRRVRVQYNGVYGVKSTRPSQMEDQQGHYHQDHKVSSLVVRH